MEISKKEKEIINDIFGKYVNKTEHLHSGDMWHAIHLFLLNVEKTLIKDYGQIDCKLPVFIKPK